MESKAEALADAEPELNQASEDLQAEIRLLHQALSAADPPALVDDPRRTELLAKQRAKAAAEADIVTNSTLQIEVREAIGSAQQILAAMPAEEMDEDE